MMLDEQAREAKRQPANTAAETGPAQATTTKREPTPQDTPVVLTSEMLTEMLAGLRDP